MSELVSMSLDLFRSPLSYPCAVDVAGHKRGAVRAFDVCRRRAPAEPRGVSLRGGQGHHVGGILGFCDARARRSDHQQHNRESTDHEKEADRQNGARAAFRLALGFPTRFVRPAKVWMQIKAPTAMSSAKTPIRLPRAPAQPRGPSPLLDASPLPVLPSYLPAAGRICRGVHGASPPVPTSPPALAPLPVPASRPASASPPTPGSTAAVTDA